MTITTEEAERLAQRLANDAEAPQTARYQPYTDHAMRNAATALRSLAAERDALLARVAELKGVLRPIACDCVDVEEDCYNDVEPGDDCVCFKARTALGEAQ